MKKKTITRALAATVLATGTLAAAPVALAQPANPITASANDVLELPQNAPFTLDMRMATNGDPVAMFLENAQDTLGSLFGYNTGNNTLQEAGRIIENALQTTFNPTELPNFITQNANGTLSSNPDQATPGLHTIRGNITEPGGKQTPVDFTFRISEALRQIGNPANGAETVMYPDTTVVTGDTVKIRPEKAPEGVQFFNGSNRDWVDVAKDGTVTLTPGDGVSDGQQRVEVRYVDNRGLAGLLGGSSEQIKSTYFLATVERRDKSNADAVEAAAGTRSVDSPAGNADAREKTAKPADNNAGNNANAHNAANKQPNPQNQAQQGEKPLAVTGANTATVAGLAGMVTVLGLIALFYGVRRESS